MPPASNMQTASIQLPPASGGLNGRSEGAARVSPASGGLNGRSDGAAQLSAVAIHLSSPVRGGHPSSQSEEA